MSAAGVAAERLRGERGTFCAIAWMRSGWPDALQRVRVEHLNGRGALRHFDAGLARAGDDDLRGRAAIRIRRRIRTGQGLRTRSAPARMKASCQRDRYGFRNLRLFLGFMMCLPIARLLTRPVMRPGFAENDFDLHEHAGLHEIRDLHRGACGPVGLFLACRSTANTLP